MALLSDSMKEKEFDVRIVKRSLSKGLVLQADIDKHMKKLTDDQDNASVLNVEELLESVLNKSKLRI